jgi:hypothetical protein
VGAAAAWRLSSDDDVDQAAGDDDDLLRRLAFHELLRFRIGQRGGFDAALSAAAATRMAAAQLAVDLDDQFDLVLLQRRRIGLRESGEPASAPGFSSA